MGLKNNGFENQQRRTDDSMKVIVIGGVAGGASAAARVRRLDAKAEVIVLEKGRDASFSNCCLPYHLSHTIEESSSLVMMTPEKFEKQHDIDVRVRHEAVEIKREEKKVVIRDLQNQNTYTETYDKLILAPGASPILPAGIGGIHRSHVHVIRNVEDIERLRAAIDRRDCTDIAVIGGGFIGVETAENLSLAGKHVTLVEGSDQIMTPFDHDIVQILHKELDDHGVDVLLDSMLTAVEEKHIVVTQRKEQHRLKADAVVMAIGVAPQTKLAKEAGLKIGETGGIWVNHNYQTSDPDIYAVGDAIEGYHALLHKPARLALAGPAQRQARAAADHIYGRQHHEHGFIGSSCLRVFQQNAACTGLSVKAAKAAGYQCDSVFIFPGDKVSLMPEANYMAFKLVFEVPTGRLLGAQAVGKGDVNKRIDVIAAMITMHAGLEDLKELELCYAPAYSTAKDVVNMAALVGLNILYGSYRQVQVEEVRALVEQGAYIIDVREESEYAKGHLRNAHNIPLSRLRERMNEIPRDTTVYLHCRSSQRSYYALCALQGNGFDNVINISGSFLGISLYEYFNDKKLKREPIVTAYNFE